MGTNYYARGKTCATCGHESDRLHIGKRSGGWRFTFRAYPDLGLTSRKAWEKHLNVTVGSVCVESEYGERFFGSDFFEWIVEPTRDAKLNGFDESARKGYTRPDDFKDGAGWAFVGGEFS
jgi:hypothetical protein